MAVPRNVADLDTGRSGSAPRDVAAFCGEVFGLAPVLDRGWIVTLAGPGPQQVQLSIAREGGPGLPVPALSIEVDDLDDTLARAAALGLRPEDGPADEPRGVRRFFLRDPAGHPVNVSSHAPRHDA